ncbi:SDR family oxidoreductase [Actinomyces viscosus]|uniref:SDR family oxidoreductase n=1 Tax=Actinomyces viscosus TaxID=1656 RepID=UPI0028EF9169|nr:SDR family oxidoreductase [Actinomyces viscosus]
MSKVVVITGASSGFGQAAARLLAQRGNKVVVAARRESRLQALVDEIRGSGGEAAYAVVDMTDSAQVEGLAQLAIDTFGAIDVWVNNAGVMPQGMFLERQIDNWDAAIDLNVKGVLYGIAAALPRMAEQKSGHIINIASVAGVMAHAGTGVYSATKWAVRAISEALREEAAQLDGNIRVTIMSPGAFETELASSVNNPNFQAGVDAFYEQFAVPAERVAATIVQAIELPEDSSWNEVIIRPTKQVL